MHKCIHIFFRFFSPHTEDPKKYRETRIREENKNAARGGGKAKVKSLSCVQLFTTPWTAAYQAPPSMGFSREEYRASYKIEIDNPKYLIWKMKN